MIRKASVTFAVGILLGLNAWGQDWTQRSASALPSARGITFERIEAESSGRKARLHLVTFSGKTHSFALMDDPQSEYDLATACAKRGAVAAVNGGYFHPDRTPLGLRVRQGKELHALERSKLLSGLLTVSGPRMALVRVGEFKRSAGLTEAIQTGPFLVDRGRAVAGLNATKSAARTVLLAAGGDRFGVLITDSLTLAETAALLATPKILGTFKVDRALNLDGGTSTGLWVSAPTPFYQREWRDVRDFVAIVPRKSE